MRIRRRSDHVGTTPDKVIGKNIRDGLGHVPDFMHLWISRVDQVFETGARLRVQDETEMQGRQYYTDSILTPIKSADGAVSSVCVVYRDVTELKRVEEALEQRIVALTRPVDAAESIVFDELFNLDDIQRLQDEFARATGVASIITHPDGTPITEPSNFCRLCSDIIRKTDKGRAKCHESDAIIGRYKREGPSVRTCLSCGYGTAAPRLRLAGNTSPTG